MVGPETNPYQPSRVPEVKVPPRPPGKAAVFLWATFALALGSPYHLWSPFLDSLPHPPSRGTHLAILVSSWVVGLLCGRLTDRWPLFGSRREGHLLLGSMIMVLAWAAAPFVPELLGPWLVVTGALLAGVLLAHAALYGGMVELARRHRAPGRFAAASVALGQLVLVLGPALGKRLDGLSIGWTAGLGAGLALSVAVGAIISEDSRGTAAEPETDRSPRPSLLRSASFWGLLAFVIAARLFGDTRENSILILVRPLVADIAPTSGQYLLKDGAALALAAAYFWLCRRVPIGALLRAALLAQALAFLSWLSPDAAGDGLFLLRSLADTALLLALATLILRAAPVGQEALAYVFLIYVPTAISGTAVPPAVRGLGLGWIPVIAVAVATSVFAALAVSALPKALTEGRDGEPEPQRVV